MVRGAAKNHANVAIVDLARPVRRPHRRAPGRAARRSRSAARSRSRPSGTRRATTSRSPRGSASVDRARRRGLRLPRLGRRHLDPRRACCATARTRTSARRSTATSHGGGIAQATQLGGKEMSYNNYVDADAALRAAYDLETPAVAIIKHANPCGIATADTIAAAHAAAHACDPVSAYGGVIAANRPITREAAESIAPIFTEVVVAPGVRARRARGAAGEEEPPPAAAARRLLARRHRAPADLRRPARADARTRSSRPRCSGSWSPATPPTPRPSPTSSSPGAPAVPVKSNAILLAHGRRLRRRRHGAGQPRRLVQARRRARGRSCRGQRRGIRRVLPVRRRRADPHRRRRARDRAAGRLDPRRRGDRRGDGRRRRRCTSPANGTSSTEC